jgi:hypothetical protein
MELSEHEHDTIWLTILFGSIGLCIQGSMLPRQALYHLSQAPAFFVFICFYVGSHAFTKIWP